MAGTNTEKPTGKAEKKKTAVAPKVKEKVTVAPVKKEEKKAVEKTEQKKPDVVKESKTKVPALPKIKKETAFVSAQNVSVSTKVGTAICKFIKNKKIEKAISDLEEVSVLKKAVPMKGEIPHRKGRIMSGRFPVKGAKEFIVLLKSLQGNANQNNMDEPIIAEAIANKGTTTYAKMGRARKKRTHVKIVCKEKKIIKQNKNKK